MSTFEALTVTLLGMSVVFIGLVLCIAFIHLLHHAARRVKWTDHGTAGESATPPPAPAPAVRPATLEPPGGAVLAVIATVLEIEQRLSQGQPAPRVTARRSVREGT